MSFLFCLKEKNSIDDIFTNTKCYRPFFVNQVIEGGHVKNGVYGQNAC